VPRKNNLGWCCSGSATWENFEMVLIAPQWCKGLHWHPPLSPRMPTRSATRSACLSPSLIPPDRRCNALRRAEWRTPQGGRLRAASYGINDQVDERADLLESEPRYSPEGTVLFAGSVFRRRLTKALK